MHEVTVYAPATIGNIGPGFDSLGLAITNMGDRVTARKKSGPGVAILKIDGDGGRLPLESESNTAAIAAQNVLTLIGAKGGVTLDIDKGVPFPSGLGSSAASAVAGGLAVNILFGEPLDQSDLLLACTEAEEEVSGGFFADNTAAALYGGIVVTQIRGKKITVSSLKGMDDIVIIVAEPDFPMPTKDSRAVLPQNVPLKDFVANMSAAAMMVAAISKKDVELFGSCVDDRIIEPARATLIPGFADVKQAALSNGALGCSICGGGGSVFAVAKRKGTVDIIGQAMKKAFSKHNVKSKIHICSIDNSGAARER